MSHSVLRKWVEFDIRDSEVKEHFLNVLDEDEKKNIFDLKKYLLMEEYLGTCGKTYLQCLKTDRLLNKMRGSIYAVVAVNKFKKLIK
jgi:hypothetical protein